MLVSNQPCQLLAYLAFVNYSRFLLPSFLITTLASDFLAPTSRSVKMADSIVGLLSELVPAASTSFIGHECFV